jgi:galactokinase/mevalonate kinase-like predicted kinase
MAAYQREDPIVTGALRELVEIAERMTEALLAADLAAVGRWLSRNWDCQQRLDPGMQTPEMRALEAVVAESRPLGGKAAGSGAGGCMFFLIGGDPATARDAATAAGTRVLEAPFVAQGAHPC